jgi:hypothetical protein
MWRNKVLWIFGIAAAIFGVHGGRGNPASMIQYTMNSGDLQRWRQMPRSMPFGPWRMMPGMPGMDWTGIMTSILAILAVLAVIGLVMFVVGLIVRYTSYGALIGMVDEIEEQESTTFRSGLRKGWRRLLYLLGTDLIIGIASTAVALVFLVVVGIAVALVLGPGVLLIAAEGRAAPIGVLLIIAGALLLFVLVFVFALVLSVTIEVVRAYAYRISVIEGEGVFDALGSALRLLRARLRPSVLVWLLMKVIHLALGVLALPLALVGAAGLFGPALGVYAVTESAAAGMVAALPGLLVVLLASAFLGGLYHTFQSAVWTLTYRELRTQKALGI